MRHGLAIPAVLSILPISNVLCAAAVATKDTLDELHNDQNMKSRAVNVSTIALKR